MLNSWRVALVLTAGFCLLLSQARNACGQESLRASMAGDVAEESQQQAIITPGFFKFLPGPVGWRFSSSLNTEYNDNILLTPNGGESDVIIQPGLSAAMHWPISLKNSLDVTLSGGYSMYVEHSDLDQFFITPGSSSGLSFDLYLGDLRINVHDRVSMTQNSSENAGVSGNNQNLVILQNSAGISAQWALSKGMLSLGYDHSDYDSLTQSQVPETASDVIFANAGFQVLPELMLGVDGGTSFTDSGQAGSSNSASAFYQPSFEQWNAGVFGSSQISQYLNARLDVGYSGIISDESSANAPIGGGSGVYASLTLSHRVNQSLSYTLSAGRSTSPSAVGQEQTFYFARLSPTWIVFKKYNLSSSLSWQQGSAVFGTATGNSDYDQYAITLSMSRQLMKRLTGEISYQFVQETSGQANLNYTDDIISLNFSYQF